MLPSYSEEHLAGLATPELWRLLVDDEDRVPRNAIAACARRGDEVLDLVQQVLEKDYYWGDDQTTGEYWLLLHAIMILGLMPGERAGGLLVAYLRKLDESGGENVASWLAGGWPALFRNKPEEVVAAVQAMADDRDLLWETRVEALEVPIDAAERSGAEALERALAWVAGIAFDESENFDMRTMAAQRLLDFARPEHRSRLERLASQDEAGLITREDIAEAYRRRQPSPPLASLIDPYAFYTPESIEERQRRWAEEAAARERVVWDEPGKSYVRETPKIGRNDPCPCGSGKKYKKCCMADQA